MSSEPKSASWHWVECDHWELPFHGLPRRIPWLNDQPPPPDKRTGTGVLEFPVQQLYQAVEAMFQEQPDAAHDPRFHGFMRQIDAGQGFISAMERGDFIAAEGVIQDAERNSHETAYLLFNKAFIFRQTDRKEEGAACYRRSTELFPDAEVVWRCYAETCEEIGDKAEAIRAYHEARRILPNHQQATLALERLGELVRVTKRGQSEETVFLNKVELRAAEEKALQEQWDDAAMLGSFGGQMLQEGLFPDIALRALQRATELDPQNAEAWRNLGVARRVNGQAEESFDALLKAQSLASENPWVLFHLAETCVVMEDVDTAFGFLDDALALDPNHAGALQLRFLSRIDQAPVQNELDVAAWSVPQEGRPQGSWRGYLLAANSAWKRNAHEPAVKFAGEAYKLAPENQEVFLTYTGMLAASGEHEWVAALTKPRLRAQEKNPRAWLNFARALKAMGLQEQAVATLRQALAELPLDRETAHGFTGDLDEWTERFAISEAELEFHPGGHALRRSIFQVRDGKAWVRLFEQGMGVPNRINLPVTFSKPRSEFDVTVEQRNQMTGEDPDPHPLGTFTVSEIDSARCGQEPVTLNFIMSEEHELVLGAQQGERKLRVVWSLYPPARHEPATNE